MTKKTEARLEEIELQAIDSNPWQPRTPNTVTDEELGDLLNSIKAVGVRTPIRVRPHPKKDGWFQIADGAMRVAVQRRLKQKTILAVIEPLTDRQMKVLAIAQNVFVRLPDRDKRTAVYKLWESEFKTDEPSKKGGKRDVEFTGVREMERETGMDQSTITGHLQAYATEQRLIGSQSTKAVKEAVRATSSRDLQAVAALAKETPKVAAKILEARTSEADERPVLRSQDVRETVKTVMAAPEKKREEVAQEILKAHEEAKEQIEQVREQTEKARQVIRQELAAAQKEAPEKTGLEEWKEEERQAQKEHLERLRAAEERQRQTMDDRAVSATIAWNLQGRTNVTVERMLGISDKEHAQKALENLDGVLEQVTEDRDALRAKWGKALDAKDAR